MNYKSCFLCLLERVKHKILIAFISQAQSRKNLITVFCCGVFLLDFIRGETVVMIY